MFTSVLRGAQFRPLAAREAALELEVEQSVKLEREPDNKYDRNAVKFIMADATETEHHIGYVHKDVAPDLAALMDAGEKFTATVIEVNGLFPKFLIEPDFDDE